MSADRPIRNLTRPAEVSPQEEEATREFVQRLNRRHQADRPGNSELSARIATYELAARMQLSAPEVTDLASEPESTHRLYCTADDNRLKAAYGRNCLLARRLLERGVRYVNLYCASRASGVDGLLNWDAHKTLKRTTSVTARSSTSRRLPCSSISDSVDCSTTRSSSGQPSSAGCRRTRKGRLAATTTRTALPAG